MKKLILSIALFCLLIGSARADLVLGTTNPVGNPLLMSAGTLSGPMLVNVVSNNPPNDVMAGWQFQLNIVPMAGSTGTLSFQDPVTGTPSNPSTYIFDGSGLGIVAINGGSQLSANDFDSNLGTVVPGGVGANLLLLDFAASPNASGLFGIYAVKDAANTIWTDSTFNTQFFSNVPDGAGTVLIGTVLVTGASGPQVIPEPSSLLLFGIVGAALASGGWWRKRKPL